MNYLPFAFVELIHQEKHAALRTYQRRRNDGLMPQSPLIPDPIGLLCQQLLSALYRGGTWIVEAIFRTGPAPHEAGSHNLTVNPKRQSLTSTVAKQTHTKTITTESEKNNVTGSLSRQIYTERI